MDPLASLGKLSEDASHGSKVSSMPIAGGVSGVWSSVDTLESEERVSDLWRKSAGRGVEEREGKGMVIGSEGDIL